MKITQSYFIRALVSDFPENKYILWTMWVLTNPQRLPLKHTTLNHFNKNFASKLNKVKVECLFWFDIPSHAIHQTNVIISSIFFFIEWRANFCDFSISSVIYKIIGSLIFLSCGFPTQKVVWLVSKLGFQICCNTLIFDFKLQFYCFPPPWWKWIVNKVEELKSEK